eukprot:TRINITY_DN11564_c0_g1_i1.p1 TRINITY_DN11564_c0_g1~~TRINITY_DN11564_c0_g1_i1.p1  ORF type:complete len:517 (+),score=66.66 TRINITY_DN11564_c0_g1_i1:83-1552(+)
MPYEGFGENTTNSRTAVACEDPSTTFLANRSVTQRFFGPLGPGSQRGAVLALASTAFGSGILALPWVFAVLGLPLGVLVLVSAGTASLISQRILANAAYATKLDDYAAIIAHSLGNSMGILLDVIMFIYTLGSVIGYFVFIEQFGPPLADSLNLPKDFQDPKRMVIVFTIFPVLPMAILRSLSALRYATMVNVASLIVVAVTVCVMCPSRLGEMTEKEEYPLAEDWWYTPVVRAWTDIPQAFAYCFYSFSCHVNLFQKYRELDSPNSKRVKKVLDRAVFLEMGVYIVVGTCGYLSLGPPCEESVPTTAWPSCTPVNILSSPRFSGPGGVIARIAMLVALLICVPVNILAGRAVPLSRIFGERQTEYGPILLVSLIFLGLSSFVAIIFSQIQVILGVLGGGCASTFMFTYPALTMLALYFFAPAPAQREPSPVPCPSPRGTFGDRRSAGADQIGNFLGVTQLGVILACVLLVPCIVLGYISAGYSVSQLF